MRGSRRRFAMVVAMVLVCLLIGAVYSPARAAEGENLLANPGFEKLDEKTKLPEGWRLGIWSTTDKDGKPLKSTAYLETSNDAHTGNNALLVRWVEGSTNVVIDPALPVPLTGAERFRLSFWFKGPKGVRAYASMLTRDAKDPQIDYKHSKSTPPKDTWQQTVFEFTTSANTTSMAIYLRVNGDGILFDDVKLERLPTK